MIINGMQKLPEVETRRGPISIGVTSAHLGGSWVAVFPGLGWLGFPRAVCFLSGGSRNKNSCTKHSPCARPWSKCFKPMVPLILTTNHFTDQTYYNLAKVNRLINGKSKV